MQVTFSPEVLHVQTNDAKQKHLLESYHNATLSKKNGYKVPRNLWAMRELAQTFPELRSIPEFVTVGKEEAAKVEALKYIRVPRWQELKTQYDDRLREYQKDDVYFLTRIQSAGVFNDPRTGKTPTIIAVLKQLMCPTSKKSAIIVVPASLVLNWKLEIEKWQLHANLYIIDGTASQRKKLYDTFVDNKHDSKILILSKDTLKGDLTKYVVFQMTFDICVVDEAHYLRSMHTLQTRSVMKINAERRFALTGTPAVRHPSDIYGILHFLYPKQFTSYWQFVDRYFETCDSTFGGGKEVGKAKPHRVKELQELVGLYSVQRKRKDVMQWLPDKQRTTMPVQMHKEQRKHYQEMVDYFATVDDESGHEVDASVIVAKLVRMRQLCLDPRLLGMKAPGAKTDAILEFVENNRKPLVIMSWFSSYLKFLQPYMSLLGLRIGMIIGETPKEYRARAVQQFQDGHLDILLCNTEAAGTGLTLDRADTIIFMDKMWNPSDNEQAEDRITPTTKASLHKHEVISFICKDTIEEAIEKALSEKKSLTDVINMGSHAAVRKLLGAR